MRLQGCYGPDMVVVDKVGRTCTVGAPKLFGLNAFADFLLALVLRDSSELIDRKALCICDSCTNQSFVSLYITSL